MNATQVGIQCLALVGILVGGSTGCVAHVAPADVSLRGFEVPVMLVGSKDRVASDGKPLPTTNVAEFEGSVAHKAVASSSGSNTLLSHESISASVSVEAVTAIKKYRPGEVDLRLTRVQPESSGFFFGTAKSRVGLTGNVVQVGSAK